MADIQNVPGMGKRVWVPSVNGYVNFPAGMPDEEITKQLAGTRHPERPAEYLIENVPQGLRTGTSADTEIADNLRKQGITEKIKPSTYARVAGAIVPAAIPGMGLISAGALGGAFEGAADAYDLPEGASMWDRAIAAGKGIVKGGVIGGLLKGAGNVIKEGVPRAYRMAVKTLEPVGPELQALENDFGSYEAAGKKVMETGAHKMGLNLRERRDVVKAWGKEGSKAADADLATAQQGGGYVDAQDVDQGFTQLRKDIFKPGSEAGPIFRDGAVEARLHQLELQTNPNLQSSSPMQNWLNAQRSTASQGYNAPMTKYYDPKAAASDPVGVYFRKGSGNIRQRIREGIDRVDPALGEQYAKNRANAQIGEAFEPIATRAAANAEAKGAIGGLPTTGFSGHAVGFHSIYDPVMRYVRPGLIPVNKGIGQLAPITKAIPDWMARGTASGLTAGPQAYEDLRGAFAPTEEEKLQALIEELRRSGNAPR